MVLRSSLACLMIIGLTPMLQASEKLINKVYHVADLVVPIEGTPGMKLSKQASPMAVGCSAAMTCTAGSSIDKAATLQNQLMKLIAHTVKPASWQEMGGTATIDYYPTGMGLVVCQSAEAHEEIAALLKELRGLQDTTISMEVRLVRVPETFLEQFNCEPSCCKEEDCASTKQRMLKFYAGVEFMGPGQQCSPGIAKSLPCAELQKAVVEAKETPVFLSEKQVRCLLEAVQGDRRASIMAAPRLVSLNGHKAMIQVGQSQTFVTGMSVEEKDGAIVYQPKSETHYLGTRLELQGVASADHRYVHAKFRGDISEPGERTPMIPVTTVVEAVEEDGKPAPFTQFIQKPNIQKIAFDKSACIPDGGTMLFVAGKVMTETRNEFGEPVLSRIPCINRLFKNVGYEREEQTVLILVTPRIIVEKEEEVKQTGCVGISTGAIVGSAKGCCNGSQCDGLMPASVVRAPDCTERCPMPSSPCCMSKSPSAAMNLADVVALASSGVSDEIILNQMMTTAARFTLGTEDILFLKRNKVSDRVVMELQNSRLRGENMPTPLPPQPAAYYQAIPQPMPCYQAVPFGTMAPTWHPGMPMIQPCPAYPPPATPAYASPSTRFEVAPMMPQLLPAPQSSSPIRSASAEFVVPGKQMSSEAAQEVGELLLDAAAELINGIGELFSSDEEVQPAAFTLPAGQYLQQPPQFLPPLPVTQSPR